ncbi:hypothetical protein F5Y09DRAFT_345419 [Xylaria sp. FL1042]|nr:hypothetical protein F5Y09DRAFT_345419 [Xylaria sp. FL1042]
MRQYSMISGIPACPPSNRVGQEAVVDTSHDTNNQALSPNQTASPFAPLLPASYRISNAEGKPDVILASPACAKDDLSVERLSDIHGWLWLAGRTMPPRPLSYQQSSARDITFGIIRGQKYLQ